jgi:hypothetical protein
MKKRVMELFSYVILICLGNIIAVVRGIKNLVNQDAIDINDPDRTIKVSASFIICSQMADNVLQIGSIVVLVAITVFIFLIVKPVFDNMYEDIFLKIGGNLNQWETYKFYSLTKSCLKMDLIINFLFMVTIMFIMYNPYFVVSPDCFLLIINRTKRLK